MRDESLRDDSSVQAHTKKLQLATSQLWSYNLQHAPYLVLIDQNVCLLSMIHVYTCHVCHVQYVLYVYL